jgi:hypothetical protein
MQQHTHTTHANAGFQLNLFAAFILSLLAADIAAASFWQAFTGDECPASRHAILILSGLAALAYVSRTLAQRPFSGESFPWWTVPLALFGGQWFGLSAHALIEHSVHISHWTLAMIAFLLIWPCRQWLHEQTHEHGHIQDILPLTAAEAEGPLPEPHLLICLVSPHTGVSLQFPAETGHYRPCTITTLPPAHQPQAAVKTVTLPIITEQGADLHARLINDIAALEPLRSNWQQLLRVFREPSIQAVPRVYFIGENQDWLDEAIRWAMPYLPNASHDTAIVPQLDDVNHLYQTLDEIIHRTGIAPERTVVDVTGGFAISSIAAAVLTTRSKTRIQWVPTFDAARRNPSNRAYDLRTILKPLPGE